MKAMVISQYGNPEVLKLKELPTPTPSDQQALIKVKAFGINRAETYMRAGHWGDVAPVSGIECVGVIESDPSGKLEKGQKVAAIMGGMGRTINGSYAEYTVVPTTNIFPITTTLSWAELAAIPESYCTAWHCLYNNLKMRSGDTLLIRGATSALGLAAINIASNHEGVHVLASTRNPQNSMWLKELGVESVLIEDNQLAEQIKKIHSKGIDGVLDIVGNTTLLDSLLTCHSRGAVCNAGFLGGGNPISFNPLIDMPSGVNLNFFASFMFGTAMFPIAKIPLQKIIQSVESGHYKAKPSQIFSFDNIAEAHQLMEASQSKGKLVIKV